jgi:hypothetical protein
MCNVGKSNAASAAMIEMTTSNSTSVKARDLMERYHSSSSRVIPSILPKIQSERGTEIIPRSPHSR